MKRKLIYTQLSARLALGGLSFLLFALASCTNMKTEMAKKWKLTSSVNPMRDSLGSQMQREIVMLKDSIENLTDTAQLTGLKEQLAQNEFALNLFYKNVKQLMTESFLDLKSNGDYNSNITGDEKGKWELSVDKKFIYFHPAEKDKSDTLIIKDFKAGGNLTLAFDSTTYLVFQPE